MHTTTTIVGHLQAQQNKGFPSGQPLTVVQQEKKLLGLQLSNPIQFLRNAGQTAQSNVARFNLTQFLNKSSLRMSEPAAGTDAMANWVERVKQIH